MKIQSNRTHYLKWKLDLGDGEYSIRYHFLWQSKKDFEQKYILKHHATGNLSIVSNDMAQHLIRKHAVKVEEIVASVYMQNNASESMRFQNKVIIDEKHITSMRGSDQDIQLNKMKHNFYDKENKIDLTK